MEQVSNTHIEIELSRYKPLLASMLSEKRLTHCIGSAFMAYELAHDSGFDEQSAFRSALLHDIAKEFSFDTQKEYAHTCPFPVPTYAFENRHRLHGFAAAGFLYAGNYPFSYMELHAIAFHTIGSEQMNALDMIVYCADKIEPGRGEAYAHYVPLWKQYCSDSKNQALQLLTLRIILDLIEKNNTEKLECDEVQEINKRLLLLKEAIERTL
ncbi:MAG TPA: bis(5'-nucleosyl)-tetraphosphatase (symmetrical) YqeK [Spirochaetales bacterium]|nr:bis(5'-nucleosyl)-tetraphosphatase (symmetrical) YqeK [Spirochaetales bacterium]HOT59386.1 bis(5'-nucleosyl)-tetraphosphatase (symmetrical) YqeK [Spirochaetales bacterium]HPD81204.1 bis(5'-nucleosyl)-tetraphosphatase (symmetrical) YqeK [Spirochaetales bacterium]HQK34559.1 bis(5'-nucleosyl)-tetraphosphatase (symmetrical) YqeK [Spirochaetales bacterium]HRV28413.1 bis(5'-nucleosyl)-tetraphosphatase (symmetrical) YqeK [Spirochaetia bacterium]